MARCCIFHLSNITTRLSYSNHERQLHCDIVTLAGIKTEQIEGMGVRVLLVPTSLLDFDRMEIYKPSVYRLDTQTWNAFSGGSWLVPVEGPVGLAL